MGEDTTMPTAIGKTVKPTPDGVQSGPKMNHRIIMERPRLTMTMKATAIAKKVMRATSWKTTTATHVVRLLNSTWSMMKKSIGETTTQTLTKKSFKQRRKCQRQNFNSILAT